MGAYPKGGSVTVRIVLLEDPYSFSLFIAFGEHSQSIPNFLDEKTRAFEGNLDVEPDVTCDVFFFKMFNFKLFIERFCDQGSPNFFFQKRRIVRVPFGKLIRSTALDVVLDLDFWGYIRRCVGGCGTHTSF